MKYSEIVLRVSTAAVMVTAMAVSARADYTTGAGGFINDTASQTVSVAEFGFAINDPFTFTPKPGALNFTSIVGANLSANYTIDSFLKTGASSDTTTVASQPLSVGGTGCSGNANVCDSMLLKITGNFSLTPGATYNISLNHDDGVLVFVNGALVLNDPGPTSTITTSSSFTGAASTSVTIYYDECCSAPAVLQGGLPALVPEPSSILLLGTLLVGAGTIVRRKYSKVS